MTFKPGVSGNPGGRPKALQEMKALAHKFGPIAFNHIVELMSSEDERISLAAAQEILNRAYGKTPQAIEHAGADGGPITFTWLPIEEVK